MRHDAWFPESPNLLLPPLRNYVISRPIPQAISPNFTAHELCAILLNSYPWIIITDKPTNAVSILMVSVERGARQGVASSEPYDQRQLMAAHQTLMQMGFFRCRATRSYLWESPHRFWALVSKGSGYVTAPCGHVVSWLGTGCSKRWGWGRVPSTLIVARGQRVGANSNNQAMN